LLRGDRAYQRPYSCPPMPRSVSGVGR